MHNSALMFVIGLGYFIWCTDAHAPTICHCSQDDINDELEVALHDSSDVQSSSPLVFNELHSIRHSRRRAMLKKHPRHAAKRYQPRISSTTCAGQCIPLSNTSSQPQHRNLLLLGNVISSSNRDKFRKCSISKRLNSTDASVFNSVLEMELLYSRTPIIQFIIYIGAQNWSESDPEIVANGIISIIDTMSDQLGNVSIFANELSNSAHSVSLTATTTHLVTMTVLDYCQKRHKICSRLTDLYLLLEQMQQLQNHPSLLDVYNTKFVKLEENGSTAVFVMPTVSPRIRISPVQKQIDKLLTMFCERERIKNRFIEIQHIQPKKSEPTTVENGDSGIPPEVSLSLGDILPINPKHYDKNRAPKMAGQPTIVYFHVTVLSIDSINEESMTYVADIFLAQSWRDPRLRLPENMKEQYRILDVEWLHDIWRPDCFFKNAKKVTFHEMSIPNHYLWLYNDKTLLYMSKLTLVLSCAMKFESYPHDTQICSMMIESLSHTTHDLMFIWNLTDPLVVNPEIELPQLDIASNNTADCTIAYSTGNFTCLAVMFKLRRRIGYHLFHTYIPSALIVVMSWISFWIKPEAIPARVTLGVTSLLTLATQNTQSQQSLPPVSYVKAIDVWMSSCSVFVFLSLMEFAVVNNYMGPIATKAMKGYSDDDIRSAVDEFKELEPRSWASTRGRGSPVRTSNAVQPQYDTFCHGHETAVFIDKFSRFFFPFSFFILNVVYWSAFL